MSTTSTTFELKMGMATREAYGQALAELGAKNPNVIALDADLAKSTFSSKFQEKFPDRVYFVKGLPKNPNGKLDRQQLKAIARRGPPKPAVPQQTKRDERAQYNGTVPLHFGLFPSCAVFCAAAGFVSDLFSRSK